MSTRLPKPGRIYLLGVADAAAWKRDVAPNLVTRVLNAGGLSFTNTGPPSKFGCFPSTWSIQSVSPKKLP